MNTILILTAKSRAAEVMRDKKTLKRARAMNNGAKHFENAGSTAARLVADLEQTVEQYRRIKRTPAQINRIMEAARKHDIIL